MHRFQRYHYGFAHGHWRQILRFTVIDVVGATIGQLGYTADKFIGVVTIRLLQGSIESSFY